MNADGVEPTVDFSDTDEQTLQVTTRSMRNALWYYENYYIQKDVVTSQATVIEGQADLIDQWESAFYVEAEKRVRAQQKATNWAVFGFTAGAFGALMLTLEFIDELRKNSTTD